MNAIFKITTLAVVLVLLACGSELEVSVTESCAGNHRPTWCNNIRSEATAAEAATEAAVTLTVLDSCQAGDPWPCNRQVDGATP